MSLGGDRYTRHPARAVERFTARRVLGADAGRPACVTLRARPHGRRGKRHGNRAASLGIGTLDHNSVGPVARDDLLLHARRAGLIWLIWESTQLGYLHESGVRKSLYPDIMVAREVLLPGDASYEIEAVGKAPELVIEILSDATSGNDKERKMVAYAQMGVSEYVLFDPRPRDRPLLAGYQLAGWGRYEPIYSAWGGGVWLGSLGLGVVPEPADRRGGARGAVALLRHRRRTAAAPLRGGSGQMAARASVGHRAARPRADRAGSERRAASAGADRADSDRRAAGPRAI